MCCLLSSGHAPPPIPPAKGWGRSPASNDAMERGPIKTDLHAADRGLLCPALHSHVQTSDTRTQTAAGSVKYAPPGGRHAAALDLPGGAGCGPHQQPADQTRRRSLYHFTIKCRIDAPGRSAWGVKTTVVSSSVFESDKPIKRESVNCSTTRAAITSVEGAEVHPCAGSCLPRPMIPIGRGLFSPFCFLTWSPHSPEPSHFF
jgi:hypothetical protein